MSTNEITGEIVEPTPHGTMPPGMVAAVCQVMGAVGKLAKDQKNNHGGYQFAGIDAFLAATGAACADAGLVVTQSESEVEVRNEWMYITYEFSIQHATGAFGPIRRQQMVHAKMGPQAFGASQSYALKNFLRGLFQIATGDADDIDAHKAEPLPPRERRSSKPAPRHDGLSESMVAEVLDAIKSIPKLTADGLCRKYSVSALGSIPARHMDEIRKGIAKLRTDATMARIGKLAEGFVGTMPAFTDSAAVLKAACAEASVDLDAITAEDAAALEHTLESWNEGIVDD